MSKVINLENEDISDNGFLGKKRGCVTISVFEGETKDKPLFFIHSDSVDVLPVSYIIEDTLYSY